MPVYEYACSQCKHEWTEESSIKSPPADDCPKCEGKTAVRLISRGTGFTLKGDGWAASGYGKPPSG